MILVDTSAWIQFFRGRGPCAPQVDALLESNEVTLCGPVLTELHRGLRAPERNKVLGLLQGCDLLSQPADLWTEAGEIGAQIKRRGVTVKTLDLLIATYALAHSVDLLTADADFVAIRDAGVPLRLVSTK